MNLTQASLRYPVTVAMAVLALVVLGAVAALRMPVSILPDIKLPVLTLITPFEGATPSEIEAQITRPLEETLGTTPGLEKMESLSVQGRSILTLHFDFGRDPQQAVLDVRDRIDLVRNALPQDAGRTQVTPRDPSGKPVLTFFAGPGAVPLGRLRAFLEDNLKGELERVPGVARVVVKGGREREIRIEAEALRLVAHGLSLSQIRERLKAGNASAPAGDLVEGRFSVLVKSSGEFKRLSEIEELVIGRSEQKAPVRLCQVARVEDTVREAESAVFLGNREGVVVEVFKESGANSVRVVESVTKTLGALRLKEGAAPRYMLEPISDDRRAIVATIRNLVSDGILGALIALLVLVLFLRDPIFPLLIGFALPASLFAAAVGLYLVGSGFNALTLGGLAVATGLILDNAIVVLDSLFEKRREGFSWVDAALMGTRRVGLSVWASSLTVLVVFLPLIFIRGVLGEFFIDLARSVIFALLASILVSLALIPVLVTRPRVSRFLDLRPDWEKAPGWAGRVFQSSRRVWDAFTGAYERALAHTLSRRRLLWSYPLVLLISVGVLVFGIRSELIPETQSRRIAVACSMPQGTTLPATLQNAQALCRQLEGLPGVSRVLLKAGLDAGEQDLEQKGSHWADLTVFLGGSHGQNRRVLSQARSLPAPPGGWLTAEWERDASVAWLSDPSRGDLELSAPDDDSLRRGMAWLRQKIPNTLKVHGASVRFEWDTTRETLQWIPRRDAMALTGHTPKELGEELRSAIGGVESGFFHQPNREIPIRLRLARSDLGGEIDSMLALVKDRPPVPLGMVIEERRTREQVQLRRLNQARSTAVFLPGPDPRKREADAAKFLRENAAPMERETQATLRSSGSAQDAGDNLRQFAFAFGLSVLFIYMLLAAQLASLKAPLLIMSGVPLIFLGIDAALLLTGHTLNLFSGLGIILLSGAVVREGVLLWERARETGGDLVKAASSRLRPILATTLTAMLTLLPLALGLGEGVEIQSSLAVTMIGGLAASSFLTLFYLPALLARFEPVRRP